MSTTTSTRSNRYRAQCGSCRLWVAPRAGLLTKSGSRWVVTCGSCADDNAGSEDDDTRTWKQRHGTCEDAPCCGCCGPGTDDPRYAYDTGENYHDDWYGGY